MHAFASRFYAGCALLVSSLVALTAGAGSPVAVRKPITWFPTTAAHWDFVRYVKAYQAATPAKYAARVANASMADLASAHAVSFEQKIDDGLGKGPRTVLVEIAQGLVDLPLETFLARLPAERWGVSLDHYLGGEVRVYSRDAQGRATRQLERMSLSALPFNITTPVTDLDMTKVEQIEYGPDAATVYWRVMFSNNRTTITDVGTVSFQRAGSKTRVVFHSGHILATPLGPIPHWMLYATIRGFFSDHVKHYRKLVTGR